MSTHRIASFVLLAGGVVLVFAGLASALGFSAAGMIASAAAIAALLYAGGVWFGGAPRVDSSVVLFTRDLTVASGPYGGRPVADLFPASVRRDLEAHCRVAIEGEASTFDAGQIGDVFEVVPVRGADGAVAYGILLSGALTKRKPAAAAG